MEESKTASVSGQVDNIHSWTEDGINKTYVEATVSAGYPYDDYAPTIDIQLKVWLNYSCETGKIWVDGNIERNRFPDYEVTGSGNGNWYGMAITSWFNGPSLWNLGIASTKDEFGTWYFK